jgi:hypothetical protein
MEVLVVVVVVVDDDDGLMREERFFLVVVFRYELDKYRFDDDNEIGEDVVVVVLDGLQ